MKTFHALLGIGHLSALARRNVSADICGNAVGIGMRGVAGDPPERLAGCSTDKTHGSLDLMDNTDLTHTCG